ncbi:MAG: PQ-loop repeat-containing protein [Bacteroidetes bacterium]|nr:PQ-loop repeat-containing protein [Bacteroidota bacterium]
MNYTAEYFGYLATFLTSVSYAPQVYKSWKSKSVGDLSIWTICILFSSTIAWLAYGTIIHSGPVIAANTIVGILTFMLVYFKFTFKK